MPKQKHNETTGKSLKKSYHYVFTKRKTKYVTGRIINLCV